MVKSLCFVTFVAHDRSDPAYLLDHYLAIINSRRELCFAEP